MTLASRDIFIIEYPLFALTKVTSKTYVRHNNDAIVLMFGQQYFVILAEI